MGTESRVAYIIFKSTTSTLNCIIQQQQLTGQRKKKKKKSLIYTTESTNLSDKVLHCTYKSNVSMTFTIYCLVTALMFSPSKDKARFNYEAILRIVFWKTTTFYRNNSANSEIQNTDLNSIPLTLQTKVTHESSVYATTSNPSRRTLSLRYSPLSF